MKKYFTPINITFFLWGVLLIAISEFFRDNVRDYLNLSIAFAVPLVLWDIIKQIKKFKTEEKKEIYNSINRMMIFGVILVIIFAITKQNHL